MRTASPALSTCRDARSASEYTAPDRTPRASSVRMIRQAISPRLATSTFSNMRGPVERVGDDHAHRRRVERVARVVDLRAVADHDEHVHLRAQVDVLSGRADPVDDAEAAVGFDGYVHEPVDVARHVALPQAVVGAGVEK